MARRKSSYAGVDKLRKTLRKMPDAIQQDVKKPMKDAENLVARSTIPEIPVDQGDLRDAYHTKMSRDGLSFKAGYWEKGNKRNWKKGGWRAHFIIFGTGGTMRKRTGSRRNGRTVRAKVSRKPRMANNFIDRGFRRVKDKIYHKINSAVDQALDRVIKAK